MTADTNPGGGATPSDVARISGAETATVGFSPEALVRRVESSLGNVGLTGVEGTAFGLPFGLVLKDGNFVLISPPRGEPWDPPEHFVPDVYAKVNMPYENLPDGQIIWADKSTIWRPSDEITNGQKISIVLDQILRGLESIPTSQTPMPSRPATRSDWDVELKS